MLTACASDGSLSPFTAGDARLAVKLPEVCEGFLVPVAEPSVTRRTDARVATLRYAGALRLANGRITRGRSCLDDQRSLYGGNTAGARARPPAKSKGTST